MRHVTPTPGTSYGRLAALAIAAALGVFSTACVNSPLSNSFASPEALAEAVLQALEQEDREALLELIVTREEHQNLLWDQLPESSHLPFDYARDLNERNSDKAITAALDDFGGNEFELISIEFKEDSEEYEAFTLHFGAVLTVRRVSDSVEGTLPILDVILEYGGRWKLMNYDE
jgi:hypothetical protein